MLRAKTERRSKAEISVRTLANKSKWKQTNLEAKVQAKVKGTRWLDWIRKEKYKQVADKKKQRKNNQKKCAEN